MPGLRLVESEDRLDNSDASSEISLSLRTEGRNLSFDALTSMAVTKQQQEQRANEPENRRLELKLEILRMQCEEAGRAREHEANMKRMEMEENNKAREHELKPEAQEALRQKLELAKCTKETDKLREDNYRRERENLEKMAKLEVERSNRREQQESQRREEKEQDSRSLRNVGLLATGVGAASGAISGALGTTTAVGVAAGMVAGAATVLAPVSGAVAVISVAGYVYKKATSSNRV